MTENPWDAPAHWVDSGSGPGYDVPVEQPHEPPAPIVLPRLSKLRGICPPVPVTPGPSGDGAVPSHVEVDALQTILERHVTGVDGICLCGDRAGEFTGRCPTGRKAAQRLTALGFQGNDVPHPAPPGCPPAPPDDGG